MVVPSLSRRRWRYNRSGGLCARDRRLRSRDFGRITKAQAAVEWFDYFVKPINPLP
jgi:hypothetical protein